MVMVMSSGDYKYSFLMLDKCFMKTICYCHIVFEKWSQKIMSRIESDFLGEREVPDDCYYGVQTLRGEDNFHITEMPM